jgi:hypothetical protein
MRGTQDDDGAQLIGSLIAASIIAAAAVGTKLQSSRRLPSKDLVDRTCKRLDGSLADKHPSG